jgi:hypothetical protein
MKAEIKAQWTAALRSDEYKQGHNYLTTVRNDGTEEDCCLAVLCKLYIKAGLPIEITRFNGRVQYDGHAYNLPGVVAEWADLDTDPCVPASGLGLPNHMKEAGWAYLSILNDSAKWDFLQIADVIDARL